MTIKTCREIAARIWCEKDFEQIPMDVDACEQIARLLYDISKDQLIDPGPEYEDPDWQDYSTIASD